MEVLERESIHAWIMNNNILTSQGQPIEFEDHLFLFDIYKDWTPEQACIKSAQVGFSEMQILKALYAADIKKLNIIYTLPTVTDVREFVPSKVDQIIRNNPCLRDRIGIKDNYSQKMVGDRFVFYKGTYSGKSKENKGESSVGIMLTSDLNVHDESDRSDQMIIEQYESRLEHSEYKGRWFFSNPSIPNVGAHKKWLLSDQKHWFIKCEKCNQQQYLTFKDNVDIEREIFMCKKCHKELTREDRRCGQWVRKWNDKNVSGYWISQLMAPWKTAEQICKQYREKTPQFFNNFVLGQPYLSSQEKVGKEIILANCIEKWPEDVKKDQVVLGVDQGLKKHYVIGNIDGEIFKYGVTEDWKDIETMLRQYNAIAVIDAMPDLTIPRKLMRKYLGRVFLCVYKRDKAQKKLYKFGTNEKFGFVYADRNAVIQKTIDDLVDNKIKYTIDPKEMGPYIDQWKTLYRTVEEDSMNIPRQVWNTTTGEDHYAHATVYYNIGRERKGILNKFKISIPSDKKTDKFKNTVDIDPYFEAAKKNQKDENWLTI